jgi:hypothetical protein
MTTTTRSTKTGEIRRTISVSFSLAGTCEARVVEDNGRKITTDTYLLTCRPVPGGKAFTVRKCDGEEVYEVVHLLCQKPTCTCPWGTHKPHGKLCRHAEACMQAVREGQLPASTTPGDAVDSGVDQSAPAAPEAKPARKLAYTFCPACGRYDVNCECPVKPAPVAADFTPEFDDP